MTGPSILKGTELFSPRHNEESPWSRILKPWEYGIGRAALGARLGNDCFPHAVGLQVSNSNKNNFAFTYLRKDRFSSKLFEKHCPTIYLHLNLGRHQQRSSWYLKPGLLREKCMPSEGPSKGSQSYHPSCDKEAKTDFFLMKQFKPMFFNEIASNLYSDITTLSPLGVRENIEKKMRGCEEAEGEGGSFLWKTDSGGWGVMSSLEKVVRFFSGYTSKEWWGGLSHVPSPCKPRRVHPSSARTLHRECTESLCELCGSPQKGVISLKIALLIKLADKLGQ